MKSIIVDQLDLEVRKYLPKHMCRWLWRALARNSIHCEWVGGVPMPRVSSKKNTN